MNDDGTFSTARRRRDAAADRGDREVRFGDHRRRRGGGGATALNLARIGKGRALLDLDQAAQAATAVATVPSTFNYLIQHSEKTGRQNNAFFAFNYLEGRFAIGDKEGMNGLPFVSLDDPRVPIIDAGPRLRRETPLFLTTKYRDHKSPTPLAMGAEARLIQAEAALAANDSAASCRS